MASTFPALALHSPVKKCQSNLCTWCHIVLLPSCDYDIYRQAEVFVEQMSIRPVSHLSQHRDYQQYTVQSNAFMFMVPPWPKYFIFVVVAINQTIKSKTGFIDAFYTKARPLCKVQCMMVRAVKCRLSRITQLPCFTWLHCFRKVQYSACSGLSATLLQKQNKTQLNKASHFFMSLGIWKRWKFTFFPLLVLPQIFLSIIKRQIEI